MHIDPSVLTADGKIDQHRIDLVGRLGSDWYVRASGNALFEVPKPARNLGIGFDKLPIAIKNSKFLTGNDLGMLANIEQLPDADSIAIFGRMNKELIALLQQDLASAEKQEGLHRLAHQLLIENKVTEAWKVLLSV
jgi:hypothetical protein